MDSNRDLRTNNSAAIIYELEKALSDWEVVKTAVQNLPGDVSVQDRVCALELLEHAQYRVADHARLWIMEQRRR